MVPDWFRIATAAASKASAVGVSPQASSPLVALVTWSFAPVDRSTSESPSLQEYPHGSGYCHNPIADERGIWEVRVEIDRLAMSIFLSSLPESDVTCSSMEPEVSTMMKTESGILREPNAWLR